ncbi:site-specific integrase [Flavonifractor sp. An52]|uniref:site-specific integrase n=1 Tax=Flavonifractor sp. An52 TaxID=1965642 RepID=UPI0031B9BAED
MQTGSYFCNPPSTEDLDCFCQYLSGEERSAATIEKYRRDVAQFAAWLGKNS